MTEPFYIGYRELLIYGFIIGVLLGLVPLFLGRRRNQARLGLYGFIASAVIGIAAPILSLVVVGIVSWVIIQKSRSEATETPDTTNDEDSQSS